MFWAETCKPWSMLPIASAQVKSALMLATPGAQGELFFREPNPQGITPSACCDGVEILESEGAFKMVGGQSLKLGMWSFLATFLPQHFFWSQRASFRDPTWFLTMWA